jgi:hypothetical protein
LDGYLIQEKDGLFYYINPDNATISNLRVSNIENRTSAEREFLKSLSTENTLEYLISISKKR